MHTCVSIGGCVEEDAQSPVKNVILADTDNHLALNSRMCGWTQMESCIVSVFPYGLFRPSHESSSNRAGLRHLLFLLRLSASLEPKIWLTVFFFIFLLLSPVKNGFQGQMGDASRRHFLCIQHLCSHLQPESISYIPPPPTTSTSDKA